YSGKQTFDLFVQADLAPGTPFEMRAALTVGGKPVEIGAQCTRPKPDPKLVKPGAVAQGTSSGGAPPGAFEAMRDPGEHGGANRPDGGKPNGETDQHVRIEVKLPEQTTIENVVVTVENTIHRWETKPSDRFWPVAVYEGDKGVSAAHVDRVGTFSGKRTFDL